MDSPPVREAMWRSLVQPAQKRWHDNPKIEKRDVISGCARARIRKGAATVLRLASIDRAVVLYQVEKVSLLARHLNEMSKRNLPQRLLLPYTLSRCTCWKYLHTRFTPHLRGAGSGRVGLPFELDPARNQCKDRPRLLLCDQSSAKRR